MADPTYLVTDDAAYNPSIRALQDSDPASASETFNPVLQQLVTNAHANHKAIQALEQRGPTLSIPVRLKGSVTISDPTQEVDLGITGGLTAEDDLDLYIDSLHADEGLDYARGADGTSLVTFAQPLAAGKVVQYKAERFLVADHGTQLAEDILTHMAGTDNPHRVTAQQVGAMPTIPTKLLYQPTVTPGWDDANNYTTPGLMVDIPSALTAKSVDNLPDTDSGMLRVYGSLSSRGEDVVQTYECYTVSGWWVRRRVSGVWTSWTSASGIQSGSNANGFWTKWPDGTMICSAYRDATIDNSYGTTYYSPGWVFPAEFFAPPILSITPAAAYGGDLYMDQTSTTKTVTGPASLKNPAVPITVNTTKMMYYIVAVGRWR